MRQLIQIIALTISPVLLFAQNTWQKVEASVFMDVIRSYEATITEGESYSLETTYKVYKNYEDEHVLQAFEGKIVCRNGNELNVYQMGHLMIQNKELNLTIDTLSKEMLVQNPDLSFYYRKTVQDYSAFSEMAEAVYMKEVNGKTGFMLEFKQGYPYSAMEFTFPEKNVLSQIVLYSNQPYYDETETYSSDKAKIVLDFKSFRKGKAVDFSNFITVSDCIVLSGNELKANGKYKNFEIIDLRN